MHCVAVLTHGYTVFYLYFNNNFAYHIVITSDCKPRDPVGSNYRRTLYDTIFYKPEDDPMTSNHVALLIA